MRRRVTAVGILLLAATPALSQSSDIALPFGPDAVVTGVTYACPGLLDPIYVTYVSDTFNDLAIVPVPGILDEPPQLIFAAVVAGSGVRYASGFYIWWTHGAEAALYDLRNGEDADAMLTCKEVPSP